MQNQIIYDKKFFEKDELLTCFVLFFGLQPYIGLPSLFPTDIQPLCLIFSVIYILKKRIFYLTPINIVITCSLLFFAVLSTFLCIFTSEPATIKEIIRRILPLYSAAIYFFTFSNILCIDNISRILKKTIFIFIIIWFIGLLLNIFTGDNVTSLLVNRSEFSQVGYVKKRYVSFFAEPSRIPEQCYFIFLFIYSMKDNYKKIYYIGIISTLIIICLSSGSGQILFALLSLFPFLLLISIEWIKNLLFYKLNNFKLYILFLFSGIAVFSFNYLENSRGGNFLRSFFGVGRSALMIDEGIKIKLSGFMFVIARLFVPEIFFLSPVDPWYVLEKELILYSRYEDVCRFFTSYEICPQTYSVYTSLGSYIVYFGYLGAFLILVFYLICFYRIINSFKITIFDRTIWLSLLFSFIMTSLVKIPLSNPSIFLSLALFLNFQTFKLKLNK